MEDLAAITDRLKLLGDPTRLRVLHLLRAEELTVGELAAALGQGQSTVSSHLARLRDAGLVQDRRDGTRAYYRFQMHALAPAERQLIELLEQRLEEDATLTADRDRMEQLLRARGEESWVDRAVGTLDRRYVPGRSFESLAAGLRGFLSFGDCVDMGCGDGSLLDLIAPPSRSLVCLDEHPGMIEAGRQRARASGYRHVRFLKGDMHAPPLTVGSADTVLFLQSLQYAADPRRALGAAARLLRPGGRTLVLTLGRHRDQRLLAEYDHLHPGFAPENLRQWLQDGGLDVDRCEQVGHDVRSPQLSIVVAQAHKLAEGGPA